MGKKFILIDHSIINVGGHHYEYAVHVLEAAGKAGYTPILVTNRLSKVDGCVPWEVYPVYKYGFWFRLTEPWWYRWVKRLSLAVKRRIVRLKIRMIFSPIGFFWSIRNQFGEYWRRRSLEDQLNLTFFILIVLGYGFRVTRSLGRLIRKAIPFRGYLSRLFSHLKEFVRVSLYPVILLISLKDWMLRWLFDNLRVKQFGRDTRRLFRNVDLQEKDIVFIPTLSTVEMMGLLYYFRKDPNSAKATWHLLFRRNLYTDRDPDYKKQDEDLRPIRNAFLRFLDGLSGHKVYFYTDSDELTAQYNRLGITLFRTLPIPHTRPPMERSRCDGEPLRIIYVGDARAEKGYHHLPRIVQDLCADYGETGKVVFVFQSNYNIPEGEPEAIIARSQLECYPRDKVMLLKEPLSSEEYWDLLSSGDINLLLYDRDNYYARSSGILIESLALGIPVIVPAGTWMAKQIADEVYRYHALLRQTMVVLKSRRGTELRWRSYGRPELNPMSKGELTFGGENTKACWLAVPKEATHLLVSFKIITPGVFVLVFADQLDRDNLRKKANTFIVGRGVETEFASIVMPLERDVVKIWLGFRNAFAESIAVISDVQIDFLKPYEPLQRCPLGAVGLSYSYPDEISDLLREMIDNYTHYRATAQDFAVRIYEKHNADRLIKELVRHTLGPLPARHKTAVALSGLPAEQISQTR